MFIKKRERRTIVKLFKLQASMNHELIEKVIDLEETVEALDGQIAQLWKEVAELKNVKASN